MEHLLDYLIECFEENKEEIIKERIEYNIGDKYKSGELQLLPLKEIREKLNAENPLLLLKISESLFDDYPTEPQVIELVKKCLEKGKEATEMLKSHIKGIKLWNRRSAAVGVLVEANPEEKEKEKEEGGEGRPPKRVRASAVGAEQLSAGNLELAPTK